jgi:PAS domain S-box
MFKKIFFRKRKEEIISADAILYKDLFSYLTSLITRPENAEQLIQIGSRAHQKSPDEVFHTYVLFEKYINSFERNQKYTPAVLRDLIKDNFPELASREPFNILFINDTEKKNTIAIQFLNAFLTDVTNQFGNAGDGYFERIRDDLNQLYEQKHKEDVFIELQMLSFEVFQFVNDNYGSNLATKLFEKNYDIFSTKYKELKVFPQLITLIPKEIVRRKHLGIFTQAQIEQIYLDKLAETEHLNIALDQKIKEQETTQKLLAKNEIMLSSVISSALDAIVMTNKDGMIIQWNSAATEIFLYKEEEVIGRSVIGTILPIAFLDKMGFKPEQFLSNPNNQLLNKRIEVVCVRKDQSTFPAELTITSFHNENEYYFNGFIRDISVRKQKEEELVNTKKRAEQAAIAKSQFLSVMSHEIRTPLNAIIGFTELLSQNSPREDQMEDLKMLKFSGESLLNIINDILDFNKLESGKVQLSNIPFNLKELIQSLYQSFSYKAKEKKIIFDVEYAENLPYVVKGDSLRLCQVLNNLISNAIKFTNEGYVRLKIELTETTNEQMNVVFSVIDTGVGIQEEKQKKIFEEFIQADSDTTRIFGGTGLGLSISNKIAELMGSRINLESEPGKGSKFYFTVRFGKSNEQHPVRSPERTSKRNEVNFKCKKILLAEDNSFNANIARRYINGWGAEMDVALDGQQAFEFALRKKYDLILMDVQMPVLDGFACTRAIRQHLPQVPIIAITAAPINEVKGEILSCGMNDYVSKPFKPNELFTKLERYLKNTPD